MNKRLIGMSGRKMKEINMTYEPVIGLEIHVELKTKSKMFCGCKNDPFHAKNPNIYTCPVCLGLPGALPVPNKKAIDWTILLGKALGATIAKISKFDRKHYFYPDLAKGYQISQYDEPFCVGGSLSGVRIRRIHLEEDTGKLMHKTINGSKVTLVDFNRSGVPLVEIVTEPDIKSSVQAKEFLKKLHQIVRYLEISDADLEKGSMRLEPNISIRLVGETQLPSFKVEVKNINSFKFVEKAIDFEIKRQTVLLDEGKILPQETRGWDEEKNATVSQRSKEDAADYRYFPEPDIPPIRFTKKDIDKMTKDMPELPEAIRTRFMAQYGLIEIEAVALTENKQLSIYYEHAVHELKDKTVVTRKDLAKWLINKKPDITKVTDKEFVTLVLNAKTVVSVSDDELKKVIQSVCTEYPKAVADYKAGKETVIMFLMGKVRMQLPKADTKIILDALKRGLEA